MRLKTTIETWPIAGDFTISRGTKRDAVVVVATVSDGRNAGRGECVPYAHYGETPEVVLKTLEKISPAMKNGLTRAKLQELMPPGAARNAVDCALWDHEAKASRTTAADLAGVALAPCVTAYTISLDTPEKMARKASEIAGKHSLLKLKLGGSGDEDRLRAVHAAVPGARLIVDANEAWTPDNTPILLEVCATCGVELVEQPLPADNDGILAEIDHPIPVCADESAHDLKSLNRIAPRYDAVNIKLDKTGGLTEALDMARAARQMGLKIMVGCMVGTSLSMAPAMLLTPFADYVDLDGPLLLARDRRPGLTYEDGKVFPPPPELWG